MVLMPEDVIKLLLALLVGGFIGAEREFRDKAAGFRTIILICVGATLFTMFSLKLGGDVDPVRIAASVVSGVGFLGAGAILRDSGQIVGLTTASTIWLAAALGMGIGGGYYLLSSVAAGVVLIVLWIFPRLERWVDNLRHVVRYEIVCPLGVDRIKEMEELLVECGLRFRKGKHTKSGQELICSWSVYGSPRDFDRLAEKLIDHPDVKAFSY